MHFKNWVSFLTGFLFASHREVDIFFKVLVLLFLSLCYLWSFSCFITNFHNFRKRVVLYWKHLRPLWCGLSLLLKCLKAQFSITRSAAMRLWLCSIRNAVRQCWWVSATSSSYLSDSNVTSKDEASSTVTSISRLFLTCIVWDSPVCLGPVRHFLFHIEIEARCHLKIISIWLRFVSALPPRQRIHERTARCGVLCVHKTTIQVTIRCLLYVLLQLNKYNSVWESWKGSRAAF